MAKENTNNETEHAKRAKEEEARLEKEKKQQQEERDKKRKKKKQKMRKMQKKEQKRIKWLVNLPFLTLFKVSSLITALAFIAIYFWIGTELYYSLIYSFFIFTSIYLGVGILLVAIFYLLSLDKEFELKEEIRLERQKELDEEKARQDEEMRELEALERELAEKKLKKDSPTAELSERNNDEPDELLTDETNIQLPEYDDSSQEPDFDFFEKTKTTSNDEDKLIPELQSPEVEDNSYLEDIFGEEFVSNADKRQ